MDNVVNDFISSDSSIKVSSLSDMALYNKHLATVSALIGLIAFNGPIRKNGKSLLNIMPIFSPNLNSLLFPSNSEGRNMLMRLNG